MTKAPYRTRFSSRSYLNRIASDPSERSPFVTGADMVIEDGDLVLTPAGDIAVNTGAELIVKALLRRLGTPNYGYRRYIMTASGLKEIDTSYKDGIYSYLSAPLSKSNARGMVSALQQAASADGRIEILEVTQSPYASADNSIHLQIKYRIRSTSELSSLALILPNQP